MGTSAEAMRTIPARSARALLECRAESQAHIFQRVMRINVQIAGGLDFQVEQAVYRQLNEHVVKEGQAGVDLVFARSV